jgi:hypothetical protein
VNCEQGISRTPCGKCQACVEISQGRFVDLLEVDATRVWMKCAPCLKTPCMRPLRAATKCT